MRCVNPNSYRFFLASCRQAAGLEKYPKSRRKSVDVTIDSDSDSGASYQDNSSDNESITGKDTTTAEVESSVRVTRARASTVNVKMPKLPKLLRADAPAADYQSPPLVTQEELTRRNQQIHLPTRIYKVKNKGFMLAVHLLSAQEEVEFFRDEDEHDLLHLEMAQTLCDREDIEVIFTNGLFSQDANGDSLILHPSDPVLSEITAQHEEMMGNARERTLAKYYMSIRFPAKIKPTTSDWEAIPNSAFNTCKCLCLFNLIWLLKFLTFLLFR